jgi:hypothetical protein
MRTHLLALALSIGLAAPAAAGTLVTPVLIAKDDETVTCTAANAGAKAVRGVLVELISFANGPGVVAETNNGPSDLAPLETTGAGISAGPGVDLYLCRFTFQGSGKLLRAGGTVGDASFHVVDTQNAY